MLKKEKILLQFLILYKLQKISSILLCLSDEAGRAIVLAIKTSQDPGSNILFAASV